MRVQGAKKIHYDSGPNMTPLVDVVMVILIFLMLAGSFGGMEHYLASTLPIKPSGGAQVDTKKTAFDDVQLDVRVDAPSNSNAWTARFGDVSTGSPEKLKEAMTAKFKQYEAQGTSKDKLQVNIDPNKHVKWKSLIAVYQAAADSGYTKIGFKTSHGG